MNHLEIQLIPSVTQYAARRLQNRHSNCDKLKVTFPNEFDQNGKISLENMAIKLNHCF